jgi:hypothetical protein
MYLNFRLSDVIENSGLSSLAFRVVIASSISDESTPRALEISSTTLSWRTSPTLLRISGILLASLSLITPSLSASFAMSSRLTWNSARAISLANRPRLNPYFARSELGRDVRRILPDGLRYLRQGFAHGQSIPLPGLLHCLTSQDSSLTASTTCHSDHQYRWFVKSEQLDIPSSVRGIL